MKELKRLKKLWKSIVILVFSFMIALAGLRVLEMQYSAEAIDPLKNTTLSVPVDVESTHYFSTNTTSEPGYFVSSACVYAFIYSPYADIFDLTYEISWDNSSWINVPFLKSDSQPQDYSQFARLGVVPIDKPTTTIVYSRLIFPPQTVELPPNVTPAIILRSIEAKIILKLEPTPKDKVLELLVCITLFSLSISIIKLLRDEWNKK